MGKQTSNYKVDRSAGEATTKIGTRLLSDEKFRRDFIKDPGKALTSAGLSGVGKVELTKRDVALLNIIGDNKINDLYQSGNFAALQEHVLSQYADLVNPALQAASAVADFDVVIEAEAVAVAVVAVAAVAIGAVERFSEVNVLQARIAGLEARLQTLEKRLG